MLGSSRPGGVDISLAGLVSQTHEDFEVVFVDYRYHKRHRQVLEAVRRSGLRQPFYHVPNHRYRADPLGSISAGYNTGFMLAAGDVVVMMMDFSYAPPTWLASHMENYNKGIVVGPIVNRRLTRIVTKDGGPYLDFTDRKNIDNVSFETSLRNILDNKERFDEISLFDKMFAAGQLDLFPVKEDGSRDAGTRELPIDEVLAGHHFHTKNESFPLYAITNINGMDEDCDRACIQGDSDLCLRLSRYLGKSPWSIQGAALHCIDPRPILPKTLNVMSATNHMPPPYDGYLPFYHPSCVRWLDRRKTDTSIVRAENPFDIKEKRRDLWSWREMSLAEEPIIPMNVVADKDYYKRDFK